MHWENACAKAGPQRAAESLPLLGGRAMVACKHESELLCGDGPAVQAGRRVLSCSTVDGPELCPRLFGRDLQLVDLPAVLLGELDEFVLGSLRAPAALTLDPVLHAPTSS